MPGLIARKTTTRTKYSQRFPFKKKYLENQKLWIRNSTRKGTIAVQIMKTSLQAKQAVDSEALNAMETTGTVNTIIHSTR